MLGRTKARDILIKVVKFNYKNESLIDFIELIEELESTLGSKLNFDAKSVYDFIRFPSENGKISKDIIEKLYNSEDKNIYNFFEVISQLNDNLGEEIITDKRKKSLYDLEKEQIQSFITMIAEARTRLTHQTQSYS